MLTSPAVAYESVSEISAMMYDGWMWGTAGAGPPGESEQISYTVGDARTWNSAQPADWVLISFLHLASHSRFARRYLVSRCARLRPGRAPPVCRRRKWRGQRPRRTGRETTPRRVGSSGRRRPCGGHRPGNPSQLLPDPRRVRRAPRLARTGTDPLTAGRLGRGDSCGVPPVATKVPCGTICV